MSVTVKRSKNISIGGILSNMKELNNRTVGIGIWDQGPIPEDNLAYRMAIHEKGYTVPHAYGNGPPVRVPARPIFKTTFDDYKKSVTNFIGKTLYPKLISGEIDQDTFLAMLGAWYEGKLKEQFVKRKFARLSPFYKIRPSGNLVTPGSIPLIDTADMRKAIKWMIDV